MQLRSSAFEHNGDIPSKYTCEGENISPPLEILDAREDVQSLVLICDDPDAAIDPRGPGKTFDHWILFDIPDTTTVIEENSVPAGAIQGSNSMSNLGYTGPCPPTGAHRYFFRIYGLNVPMLGLPKGADKAQLKASIKDRIIDKAQLVGLYQKQ